MSRTAWAALGGIALGLVIAFAAIAWWLPGPRASVPTAPPTVPASPLSTSSRATPAPTPATPAPTRERTGLPDPKLTPGSVNPNVTQDNLASTICLAGWTATIRPPAAYTNALKLAGIIEYGYTDRSPSHYQEDHLVPLELGGAPRDPRNLWPEPHEIVLADGTAVGSDAKDNLEDYLHRVVCAGAMPLGDAQRLIAGDWIAAWEAAGKP